MKIYRATAEIYDVQIDESTVLIKKLMGIDVIKANWKSSTVLDLRTNDYVVFNGLHYKINQLPNVTKTSTREYAYDVNFEGYQYSISEVAFLHDNRADFSLYTNINTMLISVRDNLNRVEGIWTYSNHSSVTDFKNIAFSADNCLSALQKICQEFKVEWYLIGHQLVIEDKVGNATGLTFEYKAGLKDIYRSNANRNNITTKLYAFGGTDNIKNDYRSGIGRLALTAALEHNISVYGTKEGSVIYDDIYPQRTGTITSATGRDFVDTGMDFDLNNYLVPGVIAKVVFKSGYLAGYVFDVKTYVHSTHTFTLLYYKDPAGFSLPNETQIIQAGDTYTLVDINMPDSYIVAAESALSARATEQLALMSVPRVTYKITPDWRYFKTNSIYLGVGDSLTIHDTDLSSSDITSRIIELQQVVIQQFKYVITVADDITYSIAEVILTEQRNTNNIIKIAGLQNAIKARANWMDTQELRNTIFDPDDYFDMDNIRPGSIETLVLTVGAKGQQFILKDIEFQPNFEGDGNSLVISAGELVHLTIDVDNIRTWAVGSYNNVILDSHGYYIYVRASKTLNTAVWIVDDTQYKTDPGGGYYFFLVGYLHTATTGGMRRISLTYGSTNITGQFITTGRITSHDGNTFFDLDDGIIGGRIQFQSGKYDDEIEEEIAAIAAVKVFTAQPTTPYYVGNLWVNNQAIFVCITERLTGSYNAAEWVDTSSEAGQALINANQALEDAYTALLAAQAAQGTANTANSTANTALSNAGTAQNTATNASAAAIAAQNTANGAGAAAAQAQLIADSKRRHFMSQPTTPYEIGDLWSTGNNLYRCIVTRLTGAYNGADWDLATYYDRTQTIIDGGLISTGRLEVGGGILGAGNAGINGSVSVNVDTDIRFWAGSNYANRALAPFRVQNDGRVIATYGLIGGWSLAIDAIYTGTKHTTTGFSSNGVTLGADGSLHAPSFYINSDGTIGLGALGSLSMLAVNGAGLKMDGVDIYEPLANDDGVYGVIYINHKGYQGGYTRYRDLVIRDGRGDNLARFYGSSKLTYLYGGLSVTGKATLNNLCQLKSYTVSELSGLDVSEGCLCMVSNTPGHGSQICAYISGQWNILVTHLGLS